MINLTEIQNKQKGFVAHLGSIEGVEVQESKFEVLEVQALALASELYEVANASKVHKYWDKAPVDQDHVKEELADCLSHLCNIANNLEVELETDIEAVQVTSLEKQFIRLNQHILEMPNRNLYFAKHKVLYFLNDFINLIYSLGFNLNEIKEAHAKKLEINYTRF